MTSYGYIGLGQMGAAMTERLLQIDGQVSVFDIEPAPVEVAVSKGAIAASSPAEVAAQSDIISICVPAAPQVDAVLHGPGGIHETAHPDQTVLIHSTVLPETVTAARDSAARWGVDLHDACVAGGFFAASLGELTVLAGGLGDLDTAAADLLHHYGTKVVDAGPVGSGAALKLGVNVMTYAQFAAARAAFELVDRAGGETDSLVETWRHLGQLGKLTETFLILGALSPEDLNEEVLGIIRSSLSVAEKDLELSAGLVETETFHGFLEAVLASMPAAFRTAADTEE